MRSYLIRSLVTLLAAGSLLGTAASAAQAAPAPVHMAFSASPAPLLQGRTVTLAGRVWARATGNRSTVLFYFKRAGTPTFVYAGYTRANARGYFSRPTVARLSGTWKAVLPGTAARQGAQRYADVAVVRRVPKRIAFFRGTTSQWSSPTIRIPVAEYRASVAYRCNDASGGFMYLNWNGRPAGFESVGSSLASGTLTLNGHDGARSGYFEVSTWLDCSWVVVVYAGTNFVRV